MNLNLFAFSVLLYYNIYLLILVLMLNPLRSMEFSIKFNTVKSGWYVLRDQRLYLQKSVVFLIMKINFVLANSADPDEMPHF